MAQSSGKSGLATLFGWRGDVIRDAPPAPYVNVTEEQRKAIEGNKAILPELTQLAEGVNEANADQFIAMMNRLIPGWSNLNNTITGNIASMARGELPQDVQNMIGRQAAEMGISTGTSGSDFDKYRSLRNLGLTSLQATDRALYSASRWMAQLSAGAPRFDFTGMFQSPAMRIQTQMWNEENRWNVAWLETQLKAQPSNAEQAYAQIADYVADYATMAASIYGNKAMQGGGGGGNMGAIEGYEGQMYVPRQGNAGTYYGLQ